MDKVTRQCPQTTTFFQEKGEPKRYRTEVLPLTSLTPYPLGQTGSLHVKLHTPLWLYHKLQVRLCTPLWLCHKLQVRLCTPLWLYHKLQVRLCTPLWLCHKLQVRLCTPQWLYHKLQVRLCTPLWLCPGGVSHPAHTHLAAVGDPTSQSIADR